VRDRIVGPVLRGLLSEDETYVGVLYLGLMWTAKGPKVIEFNARFGDPETQVLMPRIRGDFARLLKSAADGALEMDAASIDEQACVGVTLATKDYPRASTPVTGLPATLVLPEHCNAFWGNTLRSDGTTVDSAGGRVLTVTALGATTAEARTRAYEAIGSLRSQFDVGKQLTYRSDIALL
jgi:phosphoribosylamine--glycine ligase